jgi:HlyD family secretion protein
MGRGGVRAMRKKIAASLAVAAAVAASLWAFTRTEGDSTGTYRFTAVDRGDVESVVSATGTLSAVTTVQVGTQVSGIVSKIFVDFNDKVRKGQVIARIDPTLLEIAVRNAEANRERSQAELDNAERNYGRAVALREQQILSETDYNEAQYNLDSARASVKSADVGLEQARRNLAYATIFAPVSGTVVERTVDVGQTVAASLSAPTLFTIAEDLTRMQMLTSVDESDIGHIRAGQPVRFTVQAYPNQGFTGTVRQVRLQSTTQENVVNYTVVVDVANEDGRLLPGMTATVRFVVGSARDVLRVPNAALRIAPDEQMKAELAGAKAGSPPAAGVERSTPVDHARTGKLFYVDEEGRLGVAEVRTGLSDGRVTEVEGPVLHPGLRVVSGLTGSAGSASASVSNPFPASGRRSGGPPPGPGF